MLSRTMKRTKTPTFKKSELLIPQPGPAEPASKQA